MNNKSPSPEVEGSKIESRAFLNIIAKNFLSLGSMSKDFNIISENVTKLVKVKGGIASKGADRSFLRSAKAEEALESIKENEIKKEEKENKKPSKVKDKKTKLGKKGIVSKTKDKITEKIKGSIIGKKIAGGVSTTKNVMGGIIETIMSFLKSMFNPTNILKALGKIAIPLLLLTSLYTFLQDAVDEFVKSGDIWEAFKSGIGGVTELFTFGFIDKKMVGEFMDKVATFFKPVSEAIGVFFGDFADFFSEKFNKIKDFLVGSVEPKKMPVVQTVPKDQGQGKAIEDAKKKQEEPKKEEPKKEEPKKEEPKPVPKGAVTTEGGAVITTGSGGVLTTEPTPAPTPAPAPAPAPGKVSGTKPVKISSSSGKEAMISAMDSNKITDPIERAAIMAQVGHESGNFTTLSENLNYKPEQLLKIFPKYFKTPEQAKETAAQGPAAIANKVYGGRMGNDTGEDGFKYRGRGFIQLTGKNNYKKFGVDNNPDSVTEITKAADTAIQFMKGYKGSWSNIESVTKFVNGGTIGLKDRIEHFEAYKNDPKITTISGNKTSSTGTQVASASTDVSSSQRQQQKPQTPVIINAPTTNTTNIVNKKVAQSPNKNDTGSSLIARAA